MTHYISSVRCECDLMLSLWLLIKAPKWTSFCVSADSQSTVVPGATPDGEIFFCWFGPLFIFHYPIMPPCRAAGLWLWTCKPELEAHTCGLDGRQAWTGSLNWSFPVTWFSAASVLHSAFHPSHSPVNASERFLGNSTCRIRHFFHTRTSCENLKKRFITASGITLGERPLKSALKALWRTFD